MTDAESDVHSASETPAKPRPLIVAIVIVAVIGIGIVLWEEGFEHRVTNKNLSLVEPGLWRSGQISKHMIGPFLSRYQPDVIVSLSKDNPENEHNMAEYHAARAAGVERYHVSLKGDGTGDPMEYVDAIEQIHHSRAEGKTVLVHCWAGSERTGGLVALYRTLVRGQPADEAIRDELTRHGHDIDEGILTGYLNENVATIARELHSRGVIEELPRDLPTF
jgi:hypothetical protein